MARFAAPEMFTTAPSLSSACDAGRDSSVLSKCDCNTLRIALYRSLSVTVSLSVLGTPVKVGILGRFCCFASFWPGVGAAGRRLGSRWSARSAARTNDLEADEDPPHDETAGERGERGCGSSHLLPPVRMRQVSEVARAGAQPYLGPRTRSGDMMIDGVPDVGACEGVRPLNLSGKSTQQRGGDRKPTGAGRWHQRSYGQGTCATHG